MIPILSKGSRGSNPKLIKRRCSVTTLPFHECVCMVNNNVSDKKGPLPTIALLIPSCEIGGAERQFTELGKAIDKSKWNVLILVMYDKGGYFLEHGIEGVTLLNLKKTSALSFIIRLARILRQKKVVILHAYLLTAQLYAILCKMFFLWRGRLVFGIRDSMRIFYHKKVKDIVCNVAVYGFSFLVDKYIFNSNAGMRAKSGHIPSRKIKLIYNGIDTDMFRPNSAEQNFLRNQLGISREVSIVGIVGNITVYKDYPNFIEAAKIVAAQCEHVVFVVIGEDSSSLGERVKALVRSSILKDQFYFMGSRRDLERLLPGMDIVCSSSETEGFSNAICEAMACAVPCVVTDVGDSKVIVGSSGIVVPPANPEKLAQGILYILRSCSERRAAMGQAARRRIIDEFPINKMVSEHENIYSTVLKRQHGY